jgi:hypothetical protein
VFNSNFVLKPLLQCIKIAERLLGEVELLNLRKSASLVNQKPIA